MNIVEFSDFKREARIPDLFPEIGTEEPVNTATQNALQEFMDEYEMVYLLQFFGDNNKVSELYDYYNLSEIDKTDEEKNNLLKSLKTIIPYFIAYYWFRNETVQNTGIGAVIPQGQNANRTNNVDRMVFIWNKMVEGSRSLYRQYFDSEEYYSVIPNRDIFTKINVFGI